MTRGFPKAIFLFLLATAVFLSQCTEAEIAPTATAVPPTPIPTQAPNLPQITAVTLDHSQLLRYESIELTVTLTAVYSNPYDAAQISLDGAFTAPDGSQMVVPGFWDGNTDWRLRFTPSQAGDWQYSLSATDSNGTSQPSTGSFNVLPSDLHGWLLPGNTVNPDYSGRYLVHHDGTPFYGLGYGEALNILIDGFNADTGVNLFTSMVEAGENYVVWWPLYGMSPIGRSYDNYTASNMTTIDLIVRDAQAKGIYLIFTIWDHPQLRDNTHSWGTGNWAGNGFNKLTSIEEFFTSDEAWHWQTNFYRYIIARWGYSPAIGMWQTVSEINGTNAYDQTDFWHNRVNAYFVANDPYRHPTTASQSGDVDWEEGHLNMDAPQVHLYEFDDPVGAAQVIGDWTTLMWQRTAKPNWVGEFGVTGNDRYPELFHNSIWAALGAGAALTPAEWNSGGNWMRMSPEMRASLANLGQFVADIPLAQLNPEALTIGSDDPEVRGWGVAGEDGGLFWLQDFALDGQPIAEVRANQTLRQGVTVTVGGLGNGRYTITPYNTWQGIYLDAFTVECSTGLGCTIAIPDFTADIAFKISR